nr:hypothetical protein MACL_00002276 [Theileria orientalis]
MDGDLEMCNEMDSVEFKLKKKVKVFLQIEQQGYGYTVGATYKKENCSKSQKFKKTLYLDTVGSSDNLKVKEYRCYGHTLNSYFRDNIKSIKEGNFENISDSTINFRSHPDDLKDVEVKLKVAICKIKISVYDKEDRLLSNLPYTSDEYLQNRNVYVYFYNPANEKTDTLPLLFQYKDTFYGPESREKYFEKWKEISDLEGIVNSQVNVQLTNESQELKTQKAQKADKIKNKLDEIFKMLNEVDLTKKCDYGIPYCSKEFFVRAEFNTKRFVVKLSKNSKYHKFTHTSVNKYLVGSIKGVENCQFDDHVKKIANKDAINEVVVYFPDKENEPELILLNEVGYLWSTTHGYYQKQGDAYTYRHLKGGISIEFVRGNQFYDEESPTIDILTKIEDDEMVDDHSHRKMDNHAADCHIESDEDSEDGQCPTPVTDGYGESPSNNIRTKRAQPARVDNQPIENVTQCHGLPRQQTQGGNLAGAEGENVVGTQGEKLLQTKVLHTQTKECPYHGKAKEVPHEPEIVPKALIVRREAARKSEETPVKHPGTVNAKTRMYQSTGSIGQDILRKEEEEERDSVHRSENQSGVLEPDGPKNTDQQQDGVNGAGDVEVGTLPEIPCIGQGEEAGHYVNTGVKGFDEFMNGAIDYARNHPGIVSTAGAGSLLTCAGGGYGVYKLLLHFR